MQVSTSLLYLLLTAAATSILVLAQEDMEHTKETLTACCFSFTTRRIPLKYLRDYQLTSKNCPWSAVIFKTKRNRELCADPSQKWVQDAIEYLNFL